MSACASTTTALEASWVATYAEDYLDCTEEFPNLVQPLISAIRRLDSEYYDILKQLRRAIVNLPNDGTDGRCRSLEEIKMLLISGQQNGEEKLRELAGIADLVESKVTQLENDSRNFEPDKEEEPPVQTVNAVSITGARASASASTSERPSTDNNCINSDMDLHLFSSGTDPRTSSGSSGPKRPRRQKQFPDFIRDHDVPFANKKERACGSASGGAASSSGSGNQRKGKRKQKDKSSASVLFDTPVDPDEPTYCLCKQVSYGEMIGCDNIHCDIEWFHFNCVGLTANPKGKWYCPGCRGDKPNLIKPSLSSK